MEYGQQQIAKQAYLVGTGISGSVTEQREIPSACDRLNHQLSNLEASLHELHERLIPVMMQSPETAGRDKPGYPPTATPLASLINESCVRLDSLHSRVALLIRSLQI